MSEVRTARKRNAWLPNRMFDPASNPFAVQNLLERTAPPFVEQRDAVPEPIFGVDPLAGGQIAGGFEYDHSLDLPDEDFALDEVITDAFEPAVAEGTETYADFAAQAPDGIDAGFEADAVTTTQSFTTTAERDAAESGSAVATAVAATAFDSATDAASDAAADLAASSEIEAFAAAADAMAAELAASDPPALPAAVTAASDLSGAEADTNTSNTGERVAAPDLASAANTTDVAEDDAVTATTNEASAADGVAAADDLSAASDAASLADQLPDSAAVAQKIEAVRAQAYQEGLEAGRTEGRETERPLAHQQGYDEGMAAGLEQGRAETQTDQQQRQQAEHQARLDQLQSVIDQLQQLTYNPDALFEPLKKFAVHLAEQLVRGELTQSPQAISRLVDNALRELNAAGDKAVIIHLHPEDLESYRPTVEKYADSLILRPDNLLERGSVRVSLDGSVVEDVMQRRVEGVKKSLYQAPAPSWRAGGQRLSDRLQTGQPVDDVTVVESREPVPDNTLETATPSDGHA